MSLDQEPLRLPGWKRSGAPSTRLPQASARPTRRKGEAERQQQAAMVSQSAVLQQSPCAGLKDCAPLRDGGARQASQRRCLTHAGQDGDQCVLRIPLSETRLERRQIFRNRAGLQTVSIHPSTSPPQPFLITPGSGWSTEIRKRFEASGLCPRLSK